MRERIGKEAMIIIKNQKIDEKQLFNKVISDHRSSIVLGEDATYVKHYNVLELTDVETGWNSCIGIISLQNSVEPHWFLLSDNRIVIAENDELVHISLPGLEVINKKHLDTCYSEMIYQESSGTILVICTADIYCLNTDMGCLWSVATDLIESYIIDGDVITVTIEEGVQSYRCTDGTIVLPSNNIAANNS